MKEILERLKTLILALLVLLFSIYLLFFTVAEVSGSSMNPTFENGDFILVKKSIKGLKRFDKVTVHSKALNKELCKRVIGLPNDTIVISDGVLQINDKVIKEDYILDQKWGKNIELDVKLGNNEIFVMGDNRNNSMDSRELGSFELDDIDGIIIFDFTKELGITKAKCKSVLVVLWLIVFLEFILNNLRKRRSVVRS